MLTNAVETDYLVVGAGAAGMGFVDEILRQDPDCHVTLVDKRSRPGGHWNDAYSFVALHQAATLYGVNSENLGTGGASLASGAEIVRHYERALNRFRQTGRLQFFPMCKYVGDGVFDSILDPDLRYQTTVRKKVVDATFSTTEIPATTAPKYEVSPGIPLVPVNDLVKEREPVSGYVIIGAGKTGMDAVVYLLNQGVDPERITWIVSNDAWLLNRARFQPDTLLDTIIGINERIATSGSFGNLFTSLEEDGYLFRLDVGVWPTKCRCAVVSPEELAQLRLIERVVRLGRVHRIDEKEIVLDQGSIPTNSSKLHVDCTADGLARREPRPVFEDDRITLQPVQMCQPTFSAAFTGFVEANYEDKRYKNELCRAVSYPVLAEDFISAVVKSGMVQKTWLDDRKVGKWVRKSRLSPLHYVPIYKLLIKMPKIIRARRQAMEQWDIHLSKEAA